MKLCIRTANRPAYLRRLLESIARYEPWMLGLEIEVSDGSHETEEISANEGVCKTFSSLMTGRGRMLHIDALTLAHANFAMGTLGCEYSDLRNGYNLWQIMARHKGQEILLLDDDMVFPLRKPVPIPDARRVRDEWECDQYRFNHDYSTHHADELNILRNVIDEVCGAGTLQLCTYGHGVCDDYSWIDSCSTVGDPSECTQVEYANAHDRGLRSGFLTPAWIRRVPDVLCLPPDSPNDDTIMLMMHDFGKCLWSNWQIGHFRPKPKPFDRKLVTDAEIVNMVRMLYRKHDSIAKNQFDLVITMLQDAKKVPVSEPSKHLLKWINTFVLPKEVPQPGF